MVRFAVAVSGIDEHGDKFFSLGPTWSSPWIAQALFAMCACT
jgi:hypothetical protein